MSTDVFSGFFNTTGGGSGASNSAAYQQRLKDYQYKKKAYEQKQALQAMRPGMYDATKNMTPERKSQIDLQMLMMGQSPTFDKGLEGIGSNLNQRGSTLQDIASNAEKIKRFKEQRDYSIGNPELTDLQKNLKDFEALGDGSGELTPEQVQTIKFKRNEAFLEQEDQYASTIDPNKFISKRLIEGGITKALVPKYAERLDQFFPTVDAAEDIMNFAQNRRDDIQKLYKDTNNLTTRFGSLLTPFRFTTAADWERLKETVISNIGLSKIMELKAGSAQGATGLGALNEKELEMLQNQAGNLAQASTPEELKRILRRLDRDLKRLQDRRMSGLQKELVFYNNYKQYLPNGDKNPYVPSKETSRLFQGGDYTKFEVENLPLEEEPSMDDLLNKYAPQGQ